MDKEEYVKTLCKVVQMVNQLSNRKQDNRLKVICLCIYNYTNFFAKENDISLKECMSNSQDNQVDVSVILRYMHEHSIEPFDFSTISVEDVDVNNSKDLERFVLSHIYYLTQK